MSIPRIDPSFTTEDLSKVGDAFLEAGRNYWEAAHKAGMNGAIIWLTSVSGELVMFTRGEYRETLLINIDYVGGPGRSFGASGDE